MRQLGVIALPPTARVAHGHVAASVVLLGGIPALVTVIRGGDDASVGVTILVLVAAVSVAFGVDDPAANLLSSKPFDAAARRLLRFLIVAFAAAAVTTSIMVFVAAGPGLPDDLPALIAPSAAAACSASFAALIAFEREDRGSGATGLIIGLLTVAVTTGLAVRWPRIFPTIADGPIHERWWVLAGVGAAGVWRTGRDPAAR
jgi:putative flippase GtrA